jgi:hypothetical protein
LYFDNVTGIGIRNAVTIDMGEGNDHIVSVSTGMILSDGTILCGGGADVIDSIAKGFSGKDVIDMGSGDDNLRGISAGDVPGALFKSGAGVNTLTFNV